MPELLLPVFLSLGFILAMLRMFLRMMSFFLFDFVMLAGWVGSNKNSLSCRSMSVGESLEAKYSFRNSNGDMENVLVSCMSERGLG